MTATKSALPETATRDRRSREAADFDSQLYFNIERPTHRTDRWAQGQSAIVSDVPDRNAHHNSLNSRMTGTCHAGAPGGLFINIKFQGYPFANGARGKLLPARRVAVPGTGKASDMKKAVLALATAATIGVTALLTPSPAQAWRGGWGPGLAGGLIAGAVIGGIASSAYAYGPGYGYYGGPGYGYYGGYAPAYYGGYGYAPADYGGYRSSNYYAPAYYGPRYRRPYAYYGGPRYYGGYRYGW
jgi:hypothetical protein